MLLYPVLFWFAYVSNAPWWVWVCVGFSVIIKLFTAFFNVYQAGKESK